MKGKLFFALLITLLTCGMLAAQPLASGQGNKNSRQIRMIRELELTQDQVRQLKEINQKTRMNLRNAQRRFRDARAELNTVIYGENPNEEILREKIRTVVEAQAEITKVQALREFAVRKILTPEQLTRFRALRRKAAERKRKMASPRRNRRLRRGSPRRPTDRRPPSRPAPNQRP